MIYLLFLWALLPRFASPRIFILLSNLNLFLPLLAGLVFPLFFMYFDPWGPCFLRSPVNATTCSTEIWRATSKSSQCTRSNPFHLKLPSLPSMGISWHPAPAVPTKDMIFSPVRGGGAKRQSFFVRFFLPVPTKIVVVVVVVLVAVAVVVVVVVASVFPLLLPLLLLLSLLVAGEIPTTRFGGLGRERMKPCKLHLHLLITPRV